MLLDVSQETLCTHLKDHVSASLIGYCCVDTLFPVEQVMTTTTFHKVYELHVICTDDWKKRSHMMNIVIICMFHSKNQPIQSKRKLLVAIEFYLFIEAKTIAKVNSRKM